MDTELIRLILKDRVEKAADPEKLMEEFGFSEENAKAAQDDERETYEILLGCILSIFAKRQTAWHTAYTLFEASTFVAHAGEIAHEDMNKFYSLVKTRLETMEKEYNFPRHEGFDKARKSKGENVVYFDEK